MASSGVCQQPSTSLVKVDPCSHLERPIAEEQSDIHAQAELVSTPRWQSVPSSSPPSEDSTDDNNLGRKIETESLTSSVFDFESEGGRQYTANIPGYPLPNDDQELERELQQHKMFLEITENNLFFSSIGKSPQNILDIGTGGGSWALDVGDKYPSAAVLGIDRTPVQPSLVPPNVQFLVDDCEKSWSDGDVDYDFVHLRCMVSILKNVPGVIKSAFRSLRPGGWIEFQDFAIEPKCDDGTMQENDAFKTVCNLAREAYSELGFNTTSTKDLRSLLDTAGFKNVHCKEFKVPIGPWKAEKSSERLGLQQKEAMLDFIGTLAARPFRALGFSVEEAELKLLSARQALADKTVHRYLVYYFYHAQRP
ncbi:uncharacterized protein LMH87_007588 [Akanthomyces muscarius]|uniref:Methyltransferase n=1 Tax=Akanthomyces muscarius TaxID=2231603 RepID=A0A9W8QL68_AKAMU|nr:uncharacterized protein LMH87_007588 [Akanthomyces muscarius]KAJ4161556.1 hypothetical protein LMH87_007588 [Akanthomyces muscarius]